MYDAIYQDGLYQPNMTVHNWYSTMKDPNASEKDRAHARQMFNNYQQYEIEKNEKLRKDLKASGLIE